MSVAARIELEKKVIRGLLRHMKKAGWAAWRVNDGEEMVPCMGIEKRVMDAVFAVDESSIRFIPVAALEWSPPVRKAEVEHGALIVLGNDGWDAISDWNYSEGDADGFNAAMEAYSDEISKKYG
jgi:hypothetical protein